MKGTMRQRSAGTWEITINLGRDAQGVRRRRSVTVRGTKAQAQRRMRELLVEFDRGVIPPTPILLRDWLARWMAERIIPHRSGATVERYEGIIRRQIVPHLGHRQLDKITPLQIQDWETRLLREGAKSVGLMHTVLSGAYRYALRLELVSRNPVAAVSPPSAGKTETLTPPVGAVHELLSPAESSGNRHRAVIRLLAYTGLRLGEALGLTWDNVDLDEGFLLVKQSLRRRQAGLVISPPKTATGDRKVDLDAGTVAMLRRHCREQDAIRAGMGEYWQERGACFPTTAAGGPIRRG